MLVRTPDDAYETLAHMGMLSRWEPPSLKALSVAWLSHATDSRAWECDAEAGSFASTNQCNSIIWIGEA